MIDRTLLRKPEIQEKIRKKDPQFPLSQLLQFDQEHTDLLQKVEQFRHIKNELAMQGKGGVTHELRQQSLEVSKNLKEAEIALETTASGYTALALACPNIPEDDIPAGGKESNIVVREIGKKPEFSFDVKNHVELGTA